MLREEEGFTLIELIIVVAIIAILGALVTPNVLKAIENSRVVAVVADSKSIKSAALTYYADTGEWPVSTDQGSENGGNEGNDPGLVKKPGTGSPIKNWNGPYLDRWPKNPWGGTYMLIYTTINEVSKLYLKFDKVPAGAFEKLADKLGKDIVIKGIEGGNSSDEYIYICLAE